MEEIDLAKIKEIGLSLSKSVEMFNKRDFIKRISIGKEPRIKVLVGFRGLGKTTALLQLMQNKKGAYFSFDHPYVIRYSLYELGKEFVKVGYKTLFIDEVPHYKNWKIDSKALYDEFPEASFVLSGSAPLAFEPERRYEIINVDQMSLKELIEIQGKKVNVPEGAWMSSDTSLAFLAANKWIYEYYQHYLEGGGFPIYLSYGEKTMEAIYNSIKKSVWEDAPLFSKISGEEAVLMEKFLISLATSALGEFSIHSLTKHFEIKKHQGYKLISLLEKMKILHMIRPYGRGPKMVRGEPKLLFYHPNLRQAICKALDQKADIGAVREELAVFALSKRGWKVHTIKGMKKNPDYFIEKGNERVVIEIGGCAKSRRQLKDFREKTLLIDERQLITLLLV